MLKRIITILTITSLLCSAISVGFIGNAAYEDETIYGDVDGNGAVDTADARLALQLAAGVVLVTDEDQLKRTDVNYDGAITIFDAHQILRGAAGLATLQPSGAFSGFDGGGLFDNEETLVAYFNAYLNRIKVVESEENKILLQQLLKRNRIILRILILKRLMFLVLPQVQRVLRLW